MPIPKPADALRVAFAEAVSFFQRKDIVTPDAWALLDAKAKTRAFTVAGVSRVNVLSDTWRAIDAAIAKGTDFRTFQAQVGETLRRTWGGSVAAPNWRMETIFRNNVQAAYAAGRYEVTSDPDIVALRPFQLFDAIMDSRVSAVCAACDGTVLPVNDPWWLSHRPPCHHACRSGTISLSKRQADKRGVSKKKPTIAAAEGFGGPPDLGPVGPSKATPPELAAAVNKMLAAKAAGPAEAGGSSGAPPQGPPAGSPPGGGGDNGEPPGPPRRGGNWRPGHVRSDVVPAPSPTSATPVWVTSAERLPPGRDFEKLDHQASFDKDALPTARFLRAQGNNLYPLRRAKRGKSPDAVFAIEPPSSRLPPFDPRQVPPRALVEIKRLRPPAGKKTTIEKVLLDLADSTAGLGQARNIIIDASASGWSEADVPTLRLGLLETPHLKSSLDFVRVIGEDFDVTLNVGADRP